MSFKYKKLLQTTTLFLFFCLSNSYVFAFIPGANTPAETVEPKVLYTGILNAFDIQSVRVNGNIAQDGMTILSGAEIKTSNNCGAVIKIYKLGKVQLDAETSVKLVFSDQYIDLQIQSGKAVLTTYKNVKGKMTDTNGEVLTTDSSLEISSVGSNESICAGALLPETWVDSKGLFGFGMWRTFGIVASSVVTWVAVTNSSNDSQRPISSVQP